MEIILQKVRVEMDIANVQADIKRGGTCLMKHLTEQVALRKVTHDNVFRLKWDETFKKGRKRA